jgi:hypothetical protein
LETVILFLSNPLPASVLNQMKEVANCRISVYFILFTRFLKIISTAFALENNFLKTKNSFYLTRDRECGK